MATPRKPPEEHKRRGPKPKAHGVTAGRAATTDITDDERRQLAERYGSVYAGLRAGVKLALAPETK